MGRFKISLAGLLLAAAGLGTANASAQASICGPVILAGQDADDHGFETIYAALFDRIMSNVTKGGTGILAIGVDPASNAGNWIEAVAGLMASPQPVAFVNDAAIDTMSFSGFAILHVGSTNIDAGGGISFDESARLGARAIDVANHVNGGGGLFTLTQALFSNGWLYVSAVLPIEHLDATPPGKLPSGDRFTNVSATLEGQALGITDSNLDGCCFHNVFTKYPPQLEVLALAETPNDPAYHQQAVLIGGTDICLVPFCGDGKLDPGEQCDDGNNGNGDGCSATCAIEIGANQPPLVACLSCESCTLPGLCEIPGDCSSVAVCIDPDKDAVTMSCAPAGPYGLGGTSVSVTCTDGILSTTAACQVSVRDCQPPTCIAPAPLVLECQSRCGTSAVDPSITAWLASGLGQDNCSVNQATRIAPAMFPGACGAGLATPVFFSVTDGAGYQAGCASQIVVRDSLPPSIVPPPPLVLDCASASDLPATSPEIMAWLTQANASDICSDVSIQNDASATFPTGCGSGGAETTVTFTATDSCGLSVTATSTVTIRDKTPPVLGCTLPELCLWPPDHKYVCFDNASRLVSVTDACDDAPEVTALECESDQCDDAPCAAHPGQNGDGSTIDDCVWDAALDRLCVRAERAGSEPGGRHYSVSYRATDRCGNESAAVGLRLYVPHDQSPHLGCISAPPGDSE